MNEKRKPRATANVPRWEERGDKAAQSTKNHLRKMIPKLDRRDQTTFVTLEPFTADECDLLKEILLMMWKGEDARTLLYKLATGKSRPVETERDRSIAREYAAGLLNRKRPKAIRGEIAKKHGISDERVRKITRQHKDYIGSIVGH